MIITLDKDEIIEAINYFLNDTAGQSLTSKKKMTWYVDTNGEPWKLEVEPPKESEA